MMFAVTFPLTFFDGRIVRRLYDANIASTSEMGAFSQLHVNVGSCDWSPTSGLANAGAIASVALLKTGAGVRAGAVAGTGADVTLRVAVSRGDASTRASASGFGAILSAGFSTIGFSTIAFSAAFSALLSPTAHGWNAPAVPSMLICRLPLSFVTVYACGASSVTTTRTTERVNWEYRMRVIPPRATPSYASPSGRPRDAFARSTTILSGLASVKCLKLTDPSIRTTTSARPVRGTTLREMTVASFGVGSAAPAAGRAPVAPNATSIADASVRE